MEDKYELLRKSKAEIERFGYYLDNEIPMKEVQKVRKHILNNKYLMNLYGIKSPIDLTAIYTKKVKDIRKSISAKEDYQLLANALEYFRFMCMRENIDEVIPGIEFFGNLSDSKFSCLILGKASPEGQIAALVDILSDRFNASVYSFNGKTKENSSAYLVLRDETGKHYLDVYQYAGKMDCNKGFVIRTGLDDIYPLIFDDITLKIARKKVSSQLIKKLNIDSIIESLNLMKASETEMNAKFIEYIKTHQDNYDSINTNANTVVVNGYLIEASRLLELFYIAVHIRYRVMDNKKENSTFEVILDNKKTIVTLDEENQKKYIK